MSHHHSGREAFTGKAPSHPIHAHARKFDPATSVAAAASVADLTAKQFAALDVLATFGAMTDVDLVDRYELEAYSGDVPFQSASGLRTRRAELVAHGLVEDSGERVRLASGRLAIVWRAV
jgi:hypothetical protein